MGAASGQAKKDFLECGCASALFESGEGIAGEEAALVEDGNAVREQLDFGQGVGGKKERSIATPKDLRFQEAAEIHGGDGVQTAGGFIEEKHLRLVEQGAKETEALDGAGGERAHLTIQCFAELKLFRELGDAEARGAIGKVVEAPEEEQILASRKASVEAVVRAGMITEEAADGAGLARGIVTGDARGAAGREEKGGHDAQERGFAGAVGAEQGQRFAVAHFKGDAREGHGGGLLERLHESTPTAARRREGLVERIDGDGGWRHPETYNLSSPRKQSGNRGRGRGCVANADNPR